MQANCHLKRFLSHAGILLGVTATLGNSICSAEIPGYPPNPDGHDAREIAMLPRYCIHTLVFREKVPGGNNLAEIERWHSIMGPTFSHMHHYCYGLMHTNRAMILARNQLDRQFNLNASIIEFDYVINRSTVDFVLLPEILTRKGENLLRLNKTVLGIAQLQRAIEMKPDYWPPYVALSDEFKKSKDLAKAREWLQKGLLAAPDSKALHQRLAEISGGTVNSPEARASEK